MIKKLTIWLPFIRKRICAVIALSLLGQCILFPLSPSTARAETRITVTMAAGGVACGVFFFLRFVFRSSLLEPYGEERTALLNGGPGGWTIGYPTMAYSKDSKNNTAHRDRSGDAVQMEILKFRF